MALAGLILSGFGLGLLAYRGLRDDIRAVNTRVDAVNTRIDNVLLADRPREKTA